MKKPFAQGILLAFVSLAVLPSLASAAEPTASKPAVKPALKPAEATAKKNEEIQEKRIVDPALNTESTISSISAYDRTRPFPVAEKLAYFVNIKDGDKVRSPFRVAFAVSGMGVSPVAAGKIDNTGHHHILINMKMPADIKQPIPFDAPGDTKNQRYKHFGKGETETVLDLPPGKHTLRLLFADHNHVPYYVKSKEITVEVEDPKKLALAGK
jgi:hypothetical protein